MDSRVTAGVLALALALPSPAFADWGPDGVRVSAADTPSKAGARTTVAGGYAIWAGGSPTHVYLSYVLNGPANPVVVGTACGPNCDGGGSQTEPVAVLGEDDVLYVAWTDARAGCGGTCFGVYAQAFCNHGVTPAWTSPKLLSYNLSNTDPKTALAIAKVTTRGAFVAWEEGSGTGKRIAGSYVSSNQMCTAATTDSALILAPGANGVQTNPDVVSDGAGGVIVAWEDDRDPATAPDIFGQHLAADYSLGWTDAGGQICKENGSQLEPAIASDMRGGAIVAWRGTGSHGDDDIFATCVCASSSAPQFRWDSQSCAGTSKKTACGAVGNQMFPVIVSDGAQGAIIAWEDPRSLASDPNYAVYVQRLDQDGNPPVVTGQGASWPPDGKLLLNNTIAPVSQYRPTITTDGQFGAVVAWYDAAPDIYSQRIGQRGQLGIPPPLVCDTPPPSTYLQDLPGIGFVGDGSIVAWHDERTGNDVWATRRNRPELLAVGFGLPSSFGIQAWPNPFHQGLSLRLTLPERDEVLLEAFDLLGRRVRTIARGWFDAGPHVFEWNGLSDGGLQGSTGIYFLRGRIGDRAFHRQLVRIR